MLTIGYSASVDPTVMQAASVDHSGRSVSAEVQAAHSRIASPIRDTLAGGGMQVPLSDAGTRQSIPCRSRNRQCARLATLFTLQVTVEM